VMNEMVTSTLTLPPGLVLLPPVSLEDLKKDTEQDPEGAAAFVALIRRMRDTELHPFDV
jgi:hypothetical protein